MIYYCDKCKNYFKEEAIETESITYESFLGISEAAEDVSLMYVRKCPFCGNEALEKAENVEELVINLNEKNKKYEKDIKRKKIFIETVKNSYPQIYAIIRDMMNRGN